jgi:hypothetical protein
VKEASGWRFDTKAGKKEIYFAASESNELDAIEVCRGYVEAQEEYASEPRGGATQVQYAQRVIGTADKQDGLAWRDPDGTWRGLLVRRSRPRSPRDTGPRRALPRYFFKIHQRQGPHAPLGKLDFVVKGMYDRWVRARRRARGLRE